MDPLQGIEVEYEDYKIETNDCFNGNGNKTHLNTIVKEEIIIDDNPYSFECVQNYLPINDHNHDNNTEYNKNEQPSKKKKSSYVCEVCNIQFDRSYQLKRHEFIGIHTLKTNTNDDVNCVSKNQMVFHIVDEPERFQLQNPLQQCFECDLCDEVFDDIHVLDEHLQCHNRTKDRLKCELCDDIFGCMEILKNHVNAHVLNKPFKCKICELTFSNLVCLGRHTKHHFDTSYKKFQCAMCDEIFLYKDLLSSHWYKHSGFKPYKCEYCGTAFIHKFTFKLHNDLIHQN